MQRFIHPLTRAISLVSAVALLTLAPPLWAENPTFATSPDGIQPEKAASTVVITSKDAVMPVTISPNASNSVRKAAEQVATILSAMSGQTVSVNESAEPTGIVIGTLEDFPDEEIATSLDKIGKVKEIDGLLFPTEEVKPGLKRWNALEAYSIRTREGQVRLQGRTDVATRHAASRFVELLGYRRFNPSPLWEVVPAKAEIKFDAQEDRAPAFFARDLWFAFGANPQPKNHTSHLGELGSWLFAQRLGGPFRPRHSHMFGAVYRANAAFFNGNKEKYFAEIKGERSRPGKFCLSKPEVREVITNFVVNAFDTPKGGRQYTASAEPSDGAGWCECTDCVALGSPSDRTILIANEAAKAAEAKYPDSNMVGILAYHHHISIPEAPIEPNVLVHVATRMEFSPMPMALLLEEWPKKTPNVGVYEYFSTHVWGQDRMRDPGSYLPAGSSERMAMLLRRYYGQGHRFMCAESMPNFALYTPGYLTAAKLMWNLDADETLLMDDFFKNAFGPAEAPMREFYNLMSPESGRRMHNNTYSSMMDKIEEGLAKAEGNQEVAARIRQLQLYMIGEYYQNRMMRTSRAGNPDEYKAAVLDYLGWVYRTRWDWINHFSAIRSHSVGSFAARFKDPDITPKKGHVPVWMASDSYTPETIAADWKATREFFPPVPFTAHHFSPKAKLVGHPNPSDETRAFRLAAPGNLMLFGKKEEPFRFKLNLPETKSKRIILVRLLDSESKEVFRKVIDKDNFEAQELTLETPLPKDGQYRLTFVGLPNLDVTVESAQPLFSASLGSPAVVPDGHRYIYIPKEVEKLAAYIPRNGPAVGIVNPDGEFQRISADRSGIGLLPIPEKYRGRVWSLKSTQPMTFLNAPNFVFFDTDSMVTSDNVKTEE